MFDSVLVANRGEIAVRVIRTLRKLGIRSVAVHSDADADARHVREADTSVRIGPAPAAESYLNADRLLEAARRTGAQAVHPGYGFLAENAAFARRCAEAGLTFVGPPAEAIELMGDKIRAKETVRAAGVPVVPGSSGSGLTDAELAAAARQTGLPVLLKPSAGGGGKGMRLVREETALPDEIAAARREARGAFGDEGLLVERWIDRPRHIEIQVLADGHGGVLHLGERECSLQRRHQKIIEEAPSPLLDEATRQAMGEAAVEAARSCGYRGAGTVEFIVPGDGSGAYYFMEMNTRLQVEHPVTELTTGLDLVEWQLRAAAGEPLSFGQGDIALKGHALEARICAETARLATGGHDGQVDFLPSAGRVLLLEEPEGDGVRTDSGLTEGTQVGTLYDPMLAKVIVWGPDRPSALRGLRAALARTTVLGVDTNTAFLRGLLAHPQVVSGDLDTGLVDSAAAGLLPQGVPEEVYGAAALLRQAALAPEAASGVVAAPGGAPPQAARTPGGGDGVGREVAGWISPFAAPSGWRLGGEPAWTVHHLRVTGQEPVRVRVRPAGPVAGPGDGSGREAPESREVQGGPRGVEVSVEDAPPVRARLIPAESRLRLEWDGVSHTFSHALGIADDRSPAVWLGRDGETWQIRGHDPVEAALRGAGVAQGADALTAPMPGTVTLVKAAVGDEVAAGQSLLVVEAMKMEHVITAPHAGTVAELEVTAGSTVAMDQVLAVVEPYEPAEKEAS
ncbi:MULTISPECIES: biotin carboxylase N-terminal domain-containing protein [unclassified Streptomyces]|uniref:ATP-binding protein n=1 Tax=unclassified Streptomyces TaxID=2593676 RepID=UPI002DDB18EC|nr:biotin carboxylase N-terminal domain-containing protein [Streptomyces sp. NBC_01775]WSB78987.1 acetyl/propionyl-CoA carboxylase subunit alpha [Streptomyces sp. NBC_01775]WSS41596.1 acetyl/propionyl-CoA carboxylase subunit alpha [Streptomyces sp. NBC_01187]